MSSTLNGKTIAFLVAPEGIEQVELTEPWKAVQEAGGTPQLVSTDSGTVQAYNHLDKADTFDVDVTVDAGEVGRRLRRAGAARRRRQPRLPADPAGAVAFVKGVLRRPASRSPRSATRRGP